MAKINTELTGLKIWDYERECVSKIVYTQISKTGKTEIVRLITKNGIEYTTKKENVVPLEELDEEELMELGIKE